MTQEVEGSSPPIAFAFCLLEVGCLIGCLILRTTDIRGCPGTTMNELESNWLGGSRRNPHQRSLFRETRLQPPELKAAGSNPAGRTKPSFSAPGVASTPP